MFFRRLNIHIALHLTLLLGIAMFLMNAVMITVSQRVLIRAETVKGERFLSALAQYSRMSTAARENAGPLLNEFLGAAGVSLALVLDRDGNPVYTAGDPPETRGHEIRLLTTQALRSGRPVRRFSGVTWGVFWKQDRELLMAAPVIAGSETVGSVGTILPLQGIYAVLRRIQQGLLGYLVINTTILGLFGIYRISQLTVRPLRRLLERAEDYEESEEFLVPGEKEYNEYSQLSRALNRMLYRISAGKEELRATVRSLEEANQRLQKAHNDIIHAEKLASVGRLSAGIAHEIGNPIAIVMGYLDLLKQADISEEEKKEFVLRTENEINRIHTIIRQLLDLSRPSDGHLKPISVHETLNDVLNVFRLQPVMANIRLNVSLSASVDTVRADAAQLRQVFINFLMNASDAIAETGKSGELMLTTAVCSDDGNREDESGPMIEIRFTDNGVGIPAEHLHNIFDPFFTTKAPGKGTGLGLSVSYMIVEAAGGKIRATSETGRGTTMRMLLPLEISPQTEKVHDGQ